MHFFSLLLALVSLNAISDALRSTRVYDSEWGTTRNTGDRFFSPETYGGSVYSSSPSTIVSNRAFRKQVNANMVCSGALCRNGLYECGQYGGTNCYHVEHIIDRNGPSFQNCEKCKDAAGNKVMAWGRWNMALGGLARNKDYYPDVLAEKTAVYGGEMVASAMKAIQTCCARQGVLDVDSPAFIMNIIAKVKTMASTVTTVPNSAGITTYDDDCDCNPSDPDCSLGICTCDSDSECGCDCDYELEGAQLVLFADSRIAVATLTLLAIVTCLTAATAVCVCMFIRRIKNVKPGPWRGNLSVLRRAKPSGFEMLPDSQPGDSGV